MTKAFASAVVAAILLLMAASTMALGFGANTNFTALGQPLNYTVVLRLEPGEVVTQECVVADVQVGDAPVPAGKVRALLTAGASPNERLVRISTSSLVDEPVIGVGVTVNCPTRIARKFVAFVDPPRKTAVGPTIAAAAALRPAEPAAMSQVSEVLQSAMSMTSGANRPIPGDSAETATSGSVDTRKRLAERRAGRANGAAALVVAAAAPQPSGEASVAAVAPATAAINPLLLPYIGSARNDRVSPDDTDAVAPSAVAQAPAAKRSARSDRSRTDLASAEGAAANGKPAPKLTRRQQLAAARAAAKEARTQVAMAGGRKAGSGEVSGGSPAAAHAANASTTAKPITAPTEKQVASAKSSDKIVASNTAAPAADATGSTSQPAGKTTGRTRLDPAMAAGAGATVATVGAASAAASAAADARLANEAVRALAAEMAAAQTATAARLQALEEALKRANQQNAQTQASLASLRNQVAQNEADSPSSLTMGLLVGLSVALALGLVVVLMRKRSVDDAHDGDFEDSSVDNADLSRRAIVQRLAKAMGRSGAGAATSRSMPADLEARPASAAVPAVKAEPVRAATIPAPKAPPFDAGADADDEQNADDDTIAPAKAPWWKFSQRSNPIVAVMARLPSAQRVEPNIAGDDKPVKPDADQPPAATMREALSRAEMERKTTVPDTSAMAIAMRRPPSFDDESSTRRGSLGRREMSVEELMDLEQQAEFFLVLGQDDAAVDLLTGHLRDGGGASAMPYLKLMDIHRRLQDETSYEAVRDEFNLRFNANAPAWDVDPAEGKELESYGEVVTRLQSLWGTPERALEVLEASLLRSHRMQADGEQDGKSEPGFDLPAYRDVLLLYTVARDLADQSAKAAAPGMPGASAPAGRWVGRVESVDLLLPLGEADGADVDFGRATAPAPLLSTMPVETHPGVERALSLDVDVSSFGSLDDKAAHAMAPTQPLDLPRDFDYPDTIDPNDPNDFGRAKLLDADDLAALDFQLEFSLPAEPEPQPQPEPPEEVTKEELKWIGGEPSGF